MTRELLVVAGEPSGDRIAALVARAMPRVAMYGVAGPLAREAGVEVISDLAGEGAFGIADAIASGPSVARAFASLAMRVAASPPRAALLVNFSELNARVGRLLRALGTRVLFCVAPQVWAWRSGRLATLGASLDRLAVVLPFEEALWRAAGVDATYVGHPSADLAIARPLPTRRRERSIAVLPGSRPAEIARLAAPLAVAARALLDDGWARAAAVVAAPWLAPRARTALERAARAQRLDVVNADGEDGAAELLFEFDLALVASGTASLEAALAGALPVVAYRVDPIAEIAARALVRTRHVALPNVLLDRRAFPELLQRDVTPANIATAARDLLAREDEARRAVSELRALLAPPSDAPFGARVAALLAPWLRID